jgi:hypothetical protein
MKKTMDSVYSRISHILLAIYFFGGIFMRSGNYVIISVIIAVILFFSPWIYLCRGLRVDKRWIFYSCGMNPDNPQEPLPPVIAFPDDMYCRPLIFILFPKIAPNMAIGFVLFAVISSSYALSYTFARLFGMRVYLSAKEKRFSANAISEKLMSFCRNSAVGNGVILVILFMTLLISLVFVKKEVFLIFMVCFSIFATVIFLAFYISNTLIINALATETSAHSILDGQSHQIKSIQIYSLTFFSLYVLLCVLLLNVS